ncbi:DoxX family protein [Novosphingopyxis sp.]|uniref:DoxX family protein n=1 Tax=Novosphingopyxis sp. TaxID=2709690 RepID=UPI003B5BE930
MLNVALWLVQFLLFAAFTIGAWMKILFPIPKLAAMWPWAGDLPKPMVRLLGVVDLVGGVGVLLPMLTGIKPQLTVLAALGCVALQICAMIFHVTRREFASTPANIVLLAMANFILWGR